MVQKKVIHRHMWERRRENKTNAEIIGNVDEGYTGVLCTILLIEIVSQ